MAPDELVDVKFIAALTGIPERTVRKRVEEGVFHPVENRDRYRKFRLNEVVQDYSEYITNERVRKLSSDGSIDWAKKKTEAEARYRMYKADQEALHLSELEGIMHRAEDVKEIVSRLVYATRSALLALPGRVAIDTAEAGTPAETSAIVRHEVYAILEDLSNFEYSEQDYMDLVREREKWMGSDEGDGDVEAPEPDVL